LGEKKMMTPNNSEIIFDAKSGISEEEQREILAKINNIAEKNRLSLSEGEKGEGKSRKTRFKAKKTGGRFPVIVNIIAFTALAGGLTILISMQGKTDARIRTGTRIYNSAERALIEEIRRETQSAAADELERLNRDQSQSAAVEAQMSGFFANLNRQITANNLNEAVAIIKAMRDFVNTPAFNALRSIQARKELYAQAINSLETMVEETRKYQAALNSGTGMNTDTSGLQARIAQLEQNLAEKDKTIEAFSSQGTGAARRLTELERTNNTLQTRNSQLQTDLDRQTRSAAALQQNVNTLQQSERDLQTETARLNQTVNSRDATIQQRDNSIRDLQQRISRIQEVVQGKAAVNMTIAELSESVNRIQEMLGINQ
jgi:chromosome segregation ATPase